MSKWEKFKALSELGKQMMYAAVDYARTGDQWLFRIRMRQIEDDAKRIHSS